jgi:hypothetical protein
MMARRFSWQHESIVDAPQKRDVRVGECGGGKVRLISEAAYDETGSWERLRRGVFQAEVLRKVTNARFVVTSRHDGLKKRSTMGT